MPLVLVIAAGIIIAVLVLAIWPILLAGGLFVALLVGAGIILGGIGLIVGLLVFGDKMLPEATRKQIAESERLRKEARELGRQPWSPK
jgi:hypothetical protein